MQYSYEVNLTPIVFIDSTYTIDKDDRSIVIPENTVKGFNLIIINKDLHTVYSESDYEHI